MSYYRSNYTSPSGAHSYSSTNYVSPSGNSRYSSKSSYDSYSSSSPSRSRYGSGLGLSSGLGVSSRYGGSLGSLPGSSSYSSRYSDYSSSSPYSGSLYSPSISSYSKTSKYDSTGSSYTPRTDYTSRYSRPTSSYDTDYSKSTKYRSESDISSTKPARKTRFADEEDYSSTKSTKRSSDLTKASKPDDSLTTKARQRRQKRETEEGSSPVPTRSADTDVSSITRKTESLSVDSNSSQQSVPKSTGGPKPYTPPPAADGVPTKGTSAMNQQTTSSDKIPVCAKCDIEIRGPFVLALNKSWCPNHFTCAKCDSELVNMGFVELNGSVYCENDYESFYAPKCAKCRQAIVGDTVNALEKTWHPNCFVCEECGEAISSGAFHVEEGRPYCMKDWQRLFQTKCTGCTYPVEPGDKWIEALGGNWHSECFVCGVCKMPLEGTPFYPRDNKPYCKDHASA